MKRIALILKTSEVISVRKAVAIAGADHIVAHAISHHESVWFTSSQVSEGDELVGLDVVVVDSKSDEVMSAILKTAHHGKIERISHINARHAFANFNKLAA